MRNVLPRMVKHPDVGSILCAAPKSVNIQGWIEKLPNVEHVNCRPFRPFRYSSDTELHKHLDSFSPDVIFVPVERYFKYKGVPIVNMVQNMGPLVFSDINNPLGEKARNLVQTVETKVSVKKTGRIIAVSSFVRDFLVSEWSVSADRINVIYYGCDLYKNSDNNTKKPGFIPEEWGNDFLFTAGSILPLRGLEDLLSALKLIFSQKMEISGLVIAGEAPHNMGKYEKKLKDWVEANGLSSRIVWGGLLNEDEMSWCYDNCRAFVMTSRVESFGNIALEAMAHGCINIAADNPCLPEIFGNAAVYYPPGNGVALAEVIKSVMNWDSDRRDEGSERARKRAAGFSWDVTVEKTVAALKKAIATY